MKPFILDCDSAFSKRDPYIGTSGRILKSVLEQAGVDPKSIGYCQNPDDLFMEDPGKILLLGKGAVELIHGEFGILKKSVAQCHGRPVWWNAAECYVVATYSPYHVLQNPDLFRDFADDILLFCGLPDHQVIHTAPEIIVPQNIPEVFAVLRQIARQTTRHLVCDIETTGVDPLTHRILEVGLLSDPKRAVIIDGKFLEHKMVRLKLEDLLGEAYSGGHNACQFDSEFLQKEEIDWKPKWDSMLGHYTLDERQTGHGLKDLGMRLLFMPDWEAELGINYRAGETMESVPSEKRHRYLAWDLYANYLIWPIIRDEMEREEVIHVHDDILVPGGNAFRDIELAGVLVDREYLLDLAISLGNDEVGLLKDITEIASSEGMPNFNPGSPKQVVELLYNRLKLPVQKNQEGKPGTGVDQLNPLKNKHPIVQRILDFRGKSKLRGTYAEGLLQRVHPISGRIHASFLLFGTQTGRLSCQDPNLQNVPMMAGMLIRDAFVAPEGWTLMEADFNQLELKVVALFSQDEHLLNVFKDPNGDIHSSVGERIFKKPRTEISKQERYKAKLINFGLVYGRSARSLAAQPEFNSTVPEAQRYIDDFFGSFPGLKAWIEEQHQRVLDEGICISGFGRKRRFPLITRETQSSVFRQSQNTPIQSTASDLCLTALTRVHNRLNPEVARILFTVHDAILLEVRQGHEEEVARLLWEEMVTNTPIPAPFDWTIDIGWGNRWGSLKHQYPPKCHHCEHKYQDWEMVGREIEACPNCSASKSFKFSGGS